MNPKVTNFFEIYEKSLSEAVVSTVATLYADVFMFGGPRGVQSVRKEDFLRLLPGRKEHFRSLGLEPSSLASLNEISLDDKYIVARVVWKMTLKISAETSREFDAKTTYILELRNESPVIIMQLDHQDLGERVNEMRASKTEANS